MTSLAMIVVTWNNTDDAIECIKSLQAQDMKVTIVNVDNNSNSVELKKARDFLMINEFSQIHTIQTGKNGGTAGGFNAGIKWAIDNGYTFVGTLNADAVADSQWCSSLVKQLKSHSSSGIATGTLARRDGKHIDTTGEVFSTWGIPGPRLRDATIDKVPKESGEVFGSTGGGFIARTEMFKQIGLFDEKFFMYFEDVDISFRAQLAGWKVRYTPHAIAYHKLGASSSTVPGLAVYNTFKNLPILFVKNVPGRLWPSYYPRFVLAYTLILGNAIKNGRGKYALKGWLKSWVLLPHMIKERRRIQRARTVSVDYIDSIVLHDIPPEQTGLRAFRRLFTREGNV